MENPKIFAAMFYGSILMIIPAEGKKQIISMFTLNMCDPNRQNTNTQRHQTQESNWREMKG